MWLEWLFRHKGKVLGAGLGLLLGWMSIRFGLLRTLFVTVCLSIGLAIGYLVDKGKSVSESLSQILDWLDRVFSFRSSRWR